ncbi:hypothetical protein A2955_03300 [Candidatus Woesebacteria bacterium RIFCSPLOWO2_01_FULL_37_19]|uniref:Mannosyl-glycoprotein endo-beta-N-acetylglucosamidase-like domain-containing protein n=2 Tax=Candidatus Woeseibacteriota TaxID=1752722 RepID=A0A1F8BB70_9BACT|nr:MAG: hypothetical protein A2771_02880 [Candidatus Woesebacteria bacterium RIFCSPHIGHO2_01_FULL_38_26b]OGM61292.1 MAG: hypothetical protein A2955_03300 [Candidatus Woesebacteria bacterium RIFCSPLOWO2_01_FULL_37_19]
MIYVVIFFTLTPLTLITSVFSLFTLSSYKLETKEPDYVSFAYAANSGVQVYASLPSDTPSISASLVVEDARSDILREFLSDFDSPLYPFSDFIVKTSDKYGIDYRLLTAIAMKESGLCKIIPEDSHNCWGWGIHSKGTLKFSSFEEGIETVSLGLKENYLNLGLNSPSEIMSKYIPHSPGGIWAEDVSAYMDKLR